MTQVQSRQCQIGM